MGYFRAPSDILADMIADHAYFTGLAGATVNLDPTDFGRDEVIKYTVVAGALSQYTGTLDQASDDFFPGSATEPGLERHLAALSLPPRIAAQPATVQIQRDGTTGIVIGAGDQMVRAADGTIWQLQASITIGSGGTAVGTYRSAQNGQDQNSTTTGDIYNALSPTTGVSSQGASTGPALDGRDQETPAQMLVRILAFDQGDNTGGNLTWYEDTARAASSEVVSAKAVHSGPGTVQVAITAGTTDIMSALQNGVAVARLPSSDLIAAVQADIVELSPTTDTVTVVGPTEIARNVTFNYDLYDETQRSAVDPQVQLLIQYFLYTMVGGSTYYPTDLERLIQGQIGFLIRAMRCQNLGDSGAAAYVVPSSNLVKPGTITTGTFV